MTRLAAPLVIAAHVETLPTLPQWAGAGGRDTVAVYEGAALRRDDVREWATLGYVAGADDATVALEPVPDAQGMTREAGTVVSQVLVAAADVATARARVFDLLAEWAGWLGRDRVLAGTSGQARLLPDSECHLAADVALATTRAGYATANAVVTITYTAVTYG